MVWYIETKTLWRKKNCGTRAALKFSTHQIRLANLVQFREKEYDDILSGRTEKNFIGQKNWPGTHFGYITRFNIVTQNGSH